MPDFPRVTIVTPSYNQAQFLERTIQSVLDQNYPNLEYIIIDGGSTDGSVDIIRKYESHLAGWVSEMDQGQAEAINKGLRRAHGEIVAWLNSDDLHTPAAISTMVKAFSETPQMGLIFGDVLSIDQNEKVFNIMHFANWRLEDLMTFSIIGQAGVFMRRNILEKAGYLDTRFHYMLDHQLWLRMAQLAPIRYLPVVVAAARFHPEAKNVAQPSRFGQEAYAVVDWMQNQPALAEKMAQLSPRIWAGVHRFNARYLLDGGQTLAALQSYIRSLRAHPPTALVEWHRMLYAVLCLVGLQNLKSPYLRLRSFFNKQASDANNIVDRPR